MKKSLTLFLYLVLVLSSHGQQTVSGSWYGKAEIMLDGSQHNYLTEMVVKQKGKDVEGIFGYYFRNHYESFFIRGTYNTKSRTLEIPGVPLMYFRSKMTKPTVNCVMDFEATLIASRLHTNLKGYFLRDKKYKYTCPDMNILFTRDDNENSDSILQYAQAVQKNWEPGPDDPVITPEKVVEAKATVVPEEVKAFAERKTFLINEIPITSDSVRLTFYDNGDIDGDSISVYYNKVPVLTKQALSAQGINLYLRLDPQTKVHEISMFAENLGTIPPNTALMVIYDGEVRHEVFLTSSMTLNATVILRKRAP
jgi:hypothetical protein